MVIMTFVDSLGNCRFYDMFSVIETEPHASIGDVVLCDFITLVMHKSSHSH